MWVVRFGLSWATLLAAALLGISLLSQSHKESLTLGHDASETWGCSASLPPDTCQVMPERDSLAKTAAAEMVSLAQC
jgi:hypothetical protein